MTRTAIVVFVLSLLSACGQYREPRANCFNVVSRGPTPQDCEFGPLSGAPHIMEVSHE